MKFSSDNPLRLTNRFDEAVAYATIIHAGQIRKGTGIPYIAHLLAVTSIALEFGADEDEAIGALLHDAGEDAGGVGRIADIQARFGDKVAKIVEGCTDAVVIPKPPWKDRKQKYIEHVASLEASTLLVSASDKLHNARAILRDVRRDGAKTFDRFNGKKEGTLWYYRSLVTAFRQHPDSNAELIDDLDRVVAEMEKLAGCEKAAQPEVPIRSERKAIRYGDSEVPLLVRPWKRRKEMTPYYRTDFLKPGQRWSDMPTTGNYTEHYVMLDGSPMPVGALIARELRDAGATVAVLTDLTMGRLILVDPDLVCIEPNQALADLLDKLRVANGGRWAGLPDAIAIFPDGRVAMREAKVAKKDRLNKPQHEFAHAARQVLGDKLDLAVVEWGYEVAETKPAQS